jgi:hypothetical protein
MEYESVFAWFIAHLWPGFVATGIFHFGGWFTKLGRFAEMWQGK